MRPKPHQPCAISGPSQTHNPSTNQIKNKPMPGPFITRPVPVCVHPSPVGRGKWTIGGPFIHREGLSLTRAFSLLLRLPTTVPTKTSPEQRGTDSFSTLSAEGPPLLSIHITVNEKKGVNYELLYSRWAISPSTEEFGPLTQ